MVLEDDRSDLHISRYVGDKDKVEQLFERLELGRPVAT